MGNDQNNFSRTNNGFMSPQPSNHRMVGELQPINVSRVASPIPTTSEGQRNKGRKKSNTFKLKNAISGNGTVTLEPVKALEPKRPTKFNTSNIFKKIDVSNLKTNLYNR